MPFKVMLATLGLVVVTAVSAFAQAAPAPAPPATGRQLFDRLCTTCHGSADTPRAPDPSVLRRMMPERIYDAISTGNMQAHAAGLTDDGLRSIAEYLGERKLGAGAAADASSMPNRCAPAQEIGELNARPLWNGWGADLANSRAQSSAQAGLTAQRVPNLRLKWAFGIPGATAVAGQPTVALGRVFVGADTGSVYALDATTGCVHWSYRARSAVRTAGVLGRIRSGQTALFIGDMKGHVYAIDVLTGREIWAVLADDHALARITAAPALHDGRLYVAVASGEEGASTSARYPCCTFRGSVSAIDASTGQRIWKTYMIPTAPVQTSPPGAPVRWAPSGAGVWSTPTIDPMRGVLYVGTGNSYSRPAAPLTDSVVALALDSGRVVWSVQATADDAWIPACNPTAPAGNCPVPLGPDFDFGASPILVSRPDGSRLLLAAAKSGVMWALDPDRDGRVVWRSAEPRAAVNAEGELVWGGAVADGRAFIGLNSGGVTALDLATGSSAWTTVIPPRDGRRVGNSGAVSLSPGVVWSGGWDGVLRALATDSGKELWAFDTLREFQTTNGVTARGGSMGAAGPTIAAGMVFVGSGYIGVRNGTPGNVLLAFSVE